MFRPLIAATIAVTALGAPAFAQTGAATGSGEPSKVTTFFVYGDEPCPKGDGTEIIVCKRASAEEQYRIPPQLREASPAPANKAWGARVDAIEQAAEQARPGSCTPVGSFGQTGCARQAADEAAAAAEARGQEPGIPF